MAELSELYGELAYPQLLMLAQQQILSAAQSINAASLGSSAGTCVDDAIKFLSDASAYLHRAKDGEKR